MAKQDKSQEVDANLKEAPQPKDVYAPEGNELEVQQFLGQRVDELKQSRKNKLIGINRNIEDIWKEADQEYTPHELWFDNADSKRLISDDEQGLRSRYVKVGDDNWQSNASSPDLYVKVNTALAILVDQNPEAVFMAASSRWEANTKLAYSNWKNSWEVSGAKQQLKHFIFNMAKYGIGYGVTYPKRIEREKKVLKEYYKDSPEKNVYETKTIVKYNDLCRESVNPWNIWLEEGARVGDRHSLVGFYREKDVQLDTFKNLFKDYDNAKYVTGMALSRADNNVESEREPVEPTVTVGFYENQERDMYAIWVPSLKIVLYSSPLPNDDGELSLWFAPWTLRDDRSPYGIGLYEVLRNDSIMYDKLNNMTMDQLVLSIYKMFFYKGTDVLGENGQLKVTPGKGEQVTDPNAVSFLEVPGPGGEAWKGLQFIQDRKDTNSGVTTQLSGKYAGKTLGQDLQAKEAALERMKTPLDYILDALQQEAYITLSWQKQLLSTPEILQYSTPEDLAAALKEFGLTDEQIAQYVEEAQNPNEKSELLFQEEMPEQAPPAEGEQSEGLEGEVVQPRKYANVYPEARYSFEKDESGELIESEDTRFYRFGVDLPLGTLDWRGIIRVTPQSVLAPSKELSRRMDLDLYNLIFPSIEKMLALPQFIPVLMPPIKQVLKAYDKDVKDWVNEKELMKLYQQSIQPSSAPTNEDKVSMSIKFEVLTPAVQAQVLDKYFGIEVIPPLFIDANGMGGQMGQLNAPQEETEATGLTPVVPRGNIQPGSTETGAMGAAMRVE